MSDPEASGQPLADLGPRMLALLRKRLDPRVDYSAPPTPLTGGAFSVMYQFELTGATPEWSVPLVLRFVPFPGTQVLIEAGLQEGARASGVPAPAVLLVEADSDLLGFPFMVMEKVPGHGFVRGIQWHRFARSFPALLRSWPKTFREVISMLGAVDVAPVVTALSRFGISTEEALTTRHLVWASDELGRVDAFQDLIAWLTLHQPPLPSRLSLVHGDLWPANVMVEGTKVTGLVDWTLGAIGDPALDVGFACVGMARMPEPFPPPPPIRNIVHAAGLNIAGRMAEKTAALFGGASRIAYFEVLRCTVELAAVHMGRRVGRPTGWEHGIPALLAHVRRVTGIDVRYR